jgi:hypothetical protein
MKTNPRTWLNMPALEQEQRMLGNTATNTHRKMFTGSKTLRERTGKGIPANHLRTQLLPTDSTGRCKDRTIPQWLPIIRKEAD